MLSAQKTIITILLSLLITACGSNIVRESNSAEGKYKYGVALMEDERFEEALVELEEVKNKFPYSRFATLSELAIADLHFRRESFIEAQASYEIFKSLHPKHRQSDFVTYRLGLSLYKQLPSSIDRDLSLASKAIAYFNQLKRYYPNSKYVPEADKKKAAAIKMLAEKELYIANFYYKQENFAAALNRFETALNKFPQVDIRDQLLFGASSSSFKTGNKEKGQMYLAKLTAAFPESSWTGKAKQEASDAK